MGLIGEQVAFIPIGLSCQIAWQLSQNRDFLSQMTGETLTDTSSFFNWTLTDSIGLPDLLRRLNAQPIVRDSLEWPDADRTIKIKDHGVWLFHDGIGQDLTEDRVVEISQKYEYLRRNFLRMVEKPTRIFVLASVQPNVEQQHPYNDSLMHLTFSSELIADVQRTLDDLFPEGENFLIRAACANRIGTSDAYSFDEAPEWTGSAEDWQKFLAISVLDIMKIRAARQIEAARLERDALADELAKFKQTFCSPA